MDRTKLWAVAGWTLTGCVLLAGAGVRNEVRTKRLVIEDDRGQDRVVISCERDSPTVGLYDRKGVERASVSVYPDGHPVVSLMDADKATRFHVWLTDEGEPRIDLNGEDQKYSLSLLVTGKGSPWIRLKGEKGAKVIDLP